MLVGTGREVEEQYISCLWEKNVDAVDSPVLLWVRQVPPRPAHRARPEITHQDKERTCQWHRVCLFWCELTKFPSNRLKHKD